MIIGLVCHRPLLLGPLVLELGAKIAKRAYAEGRAVIDVAAEMTDLSREDLARILSPAELTRGGVQE